MQEYKQGDFRLNEYEKRIIAPYKYKLIKKKIKSPFSRCVHATKYKHALVSLRMKTLLVQPMWQITAFIGAGPD